MLDGIGFVTFQSSTVIRRMTKRFGAKTTPRRSGPSAALDRSRGVTSARDVGNDESDDAGFAG